MAGDEPGRGRMRTNDIYDVFPIEVARVAQEGLLLIVVVFFLVLEVPVEAAIRLAGNHGGNSPAGEGPGAFPHVVFRVVPHAHAEQFQQLTAPVFVDRVGVVVAVVQPVNHGRVFGQGHQQFPVVAHAHFAEHVDLLEDFVEVIDLGISRGENMVPEQDHFFLQHPLGVDHIV